MNATVKDRGSSLPAYKRIKTGPGAKSPGANVEVGLCLNLSGTYLSQEKVSLRLAIEEIFAVWSPPSLQLGSLGLDLVPSPRWNLGMRKSGTHPTGASGSRRIEPISTTMLCLWLWSMRKSIRSPWLKPLLLKHGCARLKLAATHVVVCGLVWPPSLSHVVVW